MWLELLPWLGAMTGLILASAFFSGSEAALFSLRFSDRRRMENGTRGQQLAARLLQDPDRVLSAVLFWNLVVNMAYFAIASIVSLQLSKSAGGGGSQSWVFAAAALMAIIFFSEMLPKSLAVIAPLTLSGIVSLPLSLAIRVIDPLMPALRLVNLISQRLIWPGLQPEPYLDVNDLERAIDLSQQDAAVVEQEKAVLRNIVSLSDIRVDEWMRPRTQFVSFRPPVSLRDLGGQMTPSGYLLVTEADSEEVAAALHLKTLASLPERQLEKIATPVLYMPWCATVADAWQKLVEHPGEVAAVVNEFGETIGILTLEDILDTMFTYSPSRSRLLLDRKPIHDIGPGEWIVAGVTSLRRLEKYLKIKLPRSRSVTMAGVVQERLQRLAKEGDRCRWGPYQLEVVEAPQRGHMLIRITSKPEQEESGS